MESETIFGISVKFCVDIVIIVCYCLLPGRTTYSPHSKASGVRARYGIFDHGIVLLPYN